MATAKHQLVDLDAVSTVATINNEINAFTENDLYADLGLLTLNLHAGGDFSDISQTPTSFTSFKIRFYDLNSSHSNDTFVMSFYDLDSDTWITLETFNSGNLLPTALTTKDYYSTASGYYTSASNKTSWLNALQIRLTNTIKSAGPDNVTMAIAWSYFEYDYTPASDTQLDYERSHRGVNRGANRGAV